MVAHLVQGVPSLGVLDVVVILVVVVNSCRGVAAKVGSIREGSTLACVHDGCQVALEGSEIIRLTKTGLLWVRRSRVEGGVVIGAAVGRWIGLHAGGVVGVHGR